MNTIEKIHGDYVYGRRIAVLGRHISECLPQNARVLDVGCGDGLLAKQVMEKRPDVTIEGIDVLVRPKTHIPVHEYDGVKFPFEDDSFDVVLFVDVLHHTDDANVLLKEAARVARKEVLIKDHTRDGLLAGPTLRFMDHVGNARYGVRLPYNYWSRQEWMDSFQRIGLSVNEWRKSLELYPAPASWLFDRSLHFVARLGVPAV